MEQETVLQRLVREVARRIRRRRAEFYGLRGGFYGAALALVPLLLKGFLALAAPLAALGFLLLGAASGALFGWFLRVPRHEAARMADRAFGLQDRVATALEWIPRAQRPPLVAALVEDAAARVRQLDPGRVVPRRLPSEAKFLPLPVLLSLGLLLAPPVPFPSAALPSFSATSEPEAPEDRAGPLTTDERPKGAKKAPLDRAEMMERDLTARQGSQSAHQPGDLSAVFKDTSLGTQRPDFGSFLRKGDERLRMLEQVDRLPDLKRDFTQSQHKVVFQRMKSLFGGLRPDQLSPQKLRELLEEMERMGRKGGNWGGDIGEGMEALEQGQSDRALEAMEKALSKMRALEERDRSGRSLRGGRESDRRGSRGRSAGDPGGLDDSDLGEGEGSLPGKGKNPNPKGDPTTRLRASPYDTGVEGEVRSGRKAGFDTNLLGRGANLPSRLQYLSIYSQYRKMMEEALAQEQVPRDYQTQVKEYFQSLEER
jgi:hypothetical protein